VILEVVLIAQDDVLLGKVDEVISERSDQRDM
jgi:hypothetical protein